MLTPEELKTITEKAQENIKKANKLAAETAERKRAEDAEKTYQYYLREASLRCETAAQQGRDNTRIFAWSEESRDTATNREVAGRLEIAMKEQGYMTSYKSYDFQGSDEVPSERCCELVVSW